MKGSLADLKKMRSELIQNLSILDESIGVIEKLKLDDDMQLSEIDEAFAAVLDRPAPLADLMILRDQTGTRVCPMCKQDLPERSEGNDGST
jgi:hypothetical protein